MLGRVPAGVTLTPRQVLPDGSYWAYISPADQERRARGDHLLVRVIVYTLTDPARPGYGETHRLVTTLLDAQHAPARDLVCAYHERWEIELTIDELDTHQRLVQHPLRSQKPVGVIQELYSLLLAHYAVRAIMAEAAAQAGLTPTCLSFVQAVELIRVALDDFQLVAPATTRALSAPPARHRRLPPARARRAHQSSRRQTQDVQVQAQTGRSPARLAAPRCLSDRHSHPASSPRSRHHTSTVLPPPTLQFHPLSVPCHCLNPCSALG